MVWTRLLDTSKYDGQSGARCHRDFPAELHQTTWCFDRAIEFMNKSRNGPWLMSVNTFDPHPPYDAPASLVANIDPQSMPNPRFQENDLEVQARLSSHIFQNQPGIPDVLQQQHKANYYAMIELIDSNVDRLMDTLEYSGQRDNTIIIFMGDHGLVHKGCRFYEGLWSEYHLSSAGPKTLKQTYNRTH